jgi:hypothetical protein
MQDLYIQLSQLFHLGFNFIYADNIPKANWRTSTKYRMTRGEFVKRYSDPLTLLGVGFDLFTLYVMLDVDRGSAYHPDNDPSAFKQLLEILESIGLVYPIFIRSSHSGGIHIYYFFPHPLNTFRLASYLHVNLINAGYQIKNGQLEIFPNPKPHGTSDNPTHHKAHRLPLQLNSGSYILELEECGGVGVCGCGGVGVCGCGFNDPEVEEGINSASEPVEFNLFSESESDFPTAEGVELNLPLPEETTSLNPSIPTGAVETSEVNPISFDINNSYDLDSFDSSSSSQPEEPSDIHLPTSYSTPLDITSAYHLSSAAAAENAISSAYDWAVECEALRLASDWLSVEAIVGELSPEDKRLLWAQLPQVERERLLALKSALPEPEIQIGTRLRRNASKGYAAVRDCVAVARNGLDWLVQSADGRRFNVSEYALESKIWEVEIQNC